MIGYKDMPTSKIERLHRKAEGVVGLCSASVRNLVTQSADARAEEDLGAGACRNGASHVGGEE